MKPINLISVLLLAGVFQGCVFILPTEETFSDGSMKSRTPVDYSNPVLNQRQIIIIGGLTEAVAEETIQKLLYLDSKGHEPIDIYLQTPGGLMKSAFAIEQTMRLIQSPMNTYALSECNSGGTMLLAAGTGKRRAFRGAVIVVHGLMVNGSHPKDYVARIQDSYTEFWRKHARLPQAWLPLPFDSTHILTAEQALEYGIVDEVVDR